MTDPATEVHQLNAQLLADLVSDPAATPRDFRRIYDRFLGQLAIPDGAEFEEVDADGVPSIWCSAPGASGTRAVVHFHSGGYVIGSAQGYRQFGARLSAATGARVLVPEYRLAPENPFPAAIDDGLTVFRWLRRQLGAKQLIVSGDSAGGGLMLVIMQALRDAGDDLPAGGVGLSPWTDLSLTAKSHEENRDNDPILNPTLLAALAQMYLSGTGVPSDDPRVSPLYARFDSLPPLFLMASSTECIRDDARRSHEKALSAGVQAEYHEGVNMCHIWPIYADRLPEARRALDAVGTFARECFARETACSQTWSSELEGPRV